MRVCAYTSSLEIGAKAVNPSALPAKFTNVHHIVKLPFHPKINKNSGTSIHTHIGNEVNASYLLCELVKSVK